MVRFFGAVFVCFFLCCRFFGCWIVVTWKADASKIRKLFTACTGPVGAIPREAWKRMDPTWRIVDERNAIGIVVRTQGPFPRDIFWFSKVCRNPRAINYLPPLFPRKSEQRPDTCVFFCWRGVAGRAEAWSLGVRNFYQARRHPLQSTHPAFFPRTFAVEQGQKSPQHCTAWRHAESDWPPRFRGSSWGVQTAHDGLDESYGPKDLLLLKKPMQAMFHLTLLRKHGSTEKKDKPAGTVSFPRKSGRVFKQQNLSSSLERFSQSNHSYVRSPHNISKISIIGKFILRWTELHFSFSIFPSVYSWGLQVKRSFGPKELDEDTRLDQEWTCLRFFDSVSVLCDCSYRRETWDEHPLPPQTYGLKTRNEKGVLRRFFCFPVFLFVSVVFFMNYFWARLWMLRVRFHLGSVGSVLTRVDWKPSWKKISTSVTTVAYYIWNPQAFSPNILGFIKWRTSKYSEEPRPSEVFFEIKPHE